MEKKSSSIKLAICALSFIMLSCTAVAQVATIDSKKIFTAVPEIAKADTLYANEFQRYQKEYQVFYNSTKGKIQIADSLNKKNPNADATTQAVKMATEQLAKLKSLEQESNSKLLSYKQELFRPQIEKINGAIAKVAKELKYKQVIDVQLVSLTWLDPANDITDQIIKILKTSK